MCEKRVRAGGRRARRRKEGRRAEAHNQKQGHAARSDPAPFEFFSSISVLILATLPGFCDFRMLT